MTVMAVGLDPAANAALSSEELVVPTFHDTLPGSMPPDLDVLILSLGDQPPLETVRAARSLTEASIVVVTDPGSAADGAIALHAGAEEHLVTDQHLPVLLPRAVRYAFEIGLMRRELATTDPITALPNLRGFAPTAEHHLRMADRSDSPVVFIFLRLDDLELRRRHDPEEADAIAAEAAALVVEAVRDADVPARISPDTICVLLSGDADGAETTVLSRLVEAMALRDASRGASRSLALSVGTARYEPGSGVGLGQILEDAARGLSSRDR